MGFFMDLIQNLVFEGHTVEIATNEEGSSVHSCYREWGCSVYPLSCTRIPFSGGTLRAIREIRDIVKKNQYDIVHCHTPIAAMCTRLACRPLRKKGVKVIYTAHGFHFYKGAPLKNWLLYYPVEKLCAHFTDMLITINQEDYALARKKMKAKRVEYVPGVGVDLRRFGSVQADRKEKRKELGIPENSVLLLSVGELNENKNHETVIRAIAGLDVYFMIAGKGGLEAHLQQLIDSLGMSDRVRLLGYRTDVGELYAAADLFVFPSFREGLSVSVMEAMASGLPVVCSRIRGNTDLIDEEGGRLFDPGSAEACAVAIKSMLDIDHASAGRHNREKVRQYDAAVVIPQMKRIYDVMHER